MRNSRIRPPDREDAGQPFETANDRFHRRYRYLTASSLLIATTVHFGVFALNPRMVVPATEPAGERIVALTRPPEVRIPPPPQSIARPATPRVSAGPVAEDLTISPTTFDANPAASLPPPPADVQRKEKRGPSSLELDVAPRILTGTDVAELLEQNDPRVLREAGVQGTVLLWVYVDSEGRPGDCLVHSSSGYPMLDEAAEKVAAHMRFAPAQLMDKPVAVWIAQPFEFSLRTR